MMNSSSFRQCHKHMATASHHRILQGAFSRCSNNRFLRFTYTLRSFTSSSSATPDATTAFLAKHPALPTATIPKRGLTLSKLGFGAYRVNDTQPAHRAALVKAIHAGVNVIDTSSHFGYGASETFVGSTLQELFKEGTIKREEVVIVSKAGFILSPTTTLQPEILSGIPSYAKISETSYHSIHPSFLKAQLTASLQRLQLEKIDIFMINNPERMLGNKTGGYNKTRLYKEIAEAFAYLDQEVQQGRIGGYGMCSNALHLPTTEDHLSLKAIIKTRMDFGWSLDNFVALQAPLNLFERELVTDVFPSKSLAREAKEFNIFVFTNRPLNAIAGGQIVTLENKGLHNRQETSARLLDTLDQSFTTLAEMELDIKEILDDESMALKFVWSEILSENLSRLCSNYFAAKHFLEREVLPAINRDLKALQESVVKGKNSSSSSSSNNCNHSRKLHDNNQSGDDVDDKDSDNDLVDKDAVLSWIDRYRSEAKSLTKKIAAFCQLDSDKRNDELNLVLGLICREFVSDVSPNKVENIGSPLSTKSIQYCIANPNVGCTLVGMRTPEYVHDAVASAEASERLTKKDLELIAQCPLLLATTHE
ncbi:hypothetical protein BX616_004159 [Lobosporangium transversale]|uniref:NADP-dependent oxidoreductase domain-containing protein n=1 Tax=Lobosporangium transversale TaxID=64571 RepID=A0A1Y2GJH2_9FUNG|nr:NADP-dependent oxidoreductase domain-containing protein [Lobosporangium transversale]KAF9898342.1 hypothetical protein BX616_004159 [Lobosporangium transversale]ORZ12911.1 NADP-dependent oxidoreductase domain-containing protein [Lobosporangium transversale]|eukprot:XP_021880260.1 NADP-dependent oxidoreductase domain-containing protein [Lobosporangium transversale]